MKYCCTCKLFKEEKDFAKDKSSKGGLAAQCKKCNNAANRKWYNTPRGKCIKETYSKQYRNSERGRRKNHESHLRLMFRLTLEQYDRMFEQQNGVCAICGKPESAKQNGVCIHLSVDHDHKTGKIRSLLCYRCNSILGRIYEDKNILLSMLSYLNNFEK